MFSFIVNVLVCDYMSVPLDRERKMVVDDEEMVRRASMVKDLVMVRDGVCCLSSDKFSIDAVCALISHLCLCM